MAYTSNNLLTLPPFLRENIDRLLKTHAWDNPSPHEATSEHKAIPFSAEVVPSLNKEQGPPEDTQEHAALADKTRLLISLPS